MKHYLNGTLITPRNWEDIGFLSNWSDSINMNDKDSADLRLNTETIILPNEGKKIVLSLIHI